MKAKLVKESLDKRWIIDQIKGIIAQETGYEPNVDEFEKELFKFSIFKDILELEVIVDLETKQVMPSYYKGISDEFAYRIMEDIVNAFPELSIFDDF